MEQRGMLSLLAAAALGLPSDLPRINTTTPGCALGVIENGKLTARGYGLADIETRQPITASTPFNIASISKQFTGAAAALLIAEGKLSLDDDVRRYLPELKDYGHVVRVRHLLNHSSGLRNHMALAAFSASGPLPSHEQALAMVFRQSALNFAPGTRHQYMSPAYVLLAEIVARVSGRSFEDVLADRFFKPLGMTATGFDVPVSPAYTAKPDGGFELNDRVNRARGSSGIVTTVEDFARWLAWYDSHKPMLATMTAGSRLADGTPVSYGYGLSVERDGADVRIGHGGQTAAYRSAFTYLPGQRFGAVMLCNRSDAPLGTVETLIDGRFPKPKSAALTSEPLSEAETTAFAGLYHDPVADELRVFAAEKGVLQLVYAGQPYPLTYLGDGRFAFEDYAEFGFAPDGTLVETAADQAPIAFTRIEQGEPSPLEDFAGRYRSPDVDGEIEISAEGDKLLVKTANGSAKLAQIHPDGFAAPEADFAHMAFTRDAAGKVDGFILTTMSGINRMRFARL